MPHPPLIAACADDDVLGAAFYLMEPIDGVNPTVALPAGLHRDETRRWELGLAMADGAASIGAVDHVAVGLTDLGKPEGFLERQVERWRRSSTRTRRSTATPDPTSPASNESPSGSTPIDRAPRGPGSSTATTTWPT